MRSTRSGIALVVTVIGLAASVASLVDFFGPTFCAASGCATVRASPWAHPLGVPMPVLGIAYFAAMLFVRGRLRLALAIAGGAWALGLVALQAFVIGAWCKLCLVVDPAAIVLAVTAGRERPRLTWLAAPALAAVGLVLVWWTHEAMPPAATMPPDAIVEYLDFECPFCRELAPKLAAALPADATVVRKMVPLPMHPHAMTAALAWCCADAQGKGDAMAAALFAAPPDELTPAGCERIAETVGCDLARYRHDLPAMADRVAADLEQAKRANVRSLPTVYIGGQRFIDADVTVSELKAAVARVML